MALIHKGILIILDGLGDRPCPELNDLTPLEAAQTPSLDGLVEKGMCAMVDPLFPGVPVDTHTGIALLMGLPQQAAIDLARGPVEAAGIGLSLQPGDVAVRCNFATLKEKDGRLQVVDRRAGRIREQTDELAALLQDVDLGDRIMADLHAASQHRAVLHLKGFGLSAEISDTDPGVLNVGGNILPCRPLSSNPAAAITARAINRFIWLAHERLNSSDICRQRQEDGSPVANGIISRSAGKHEQLHTLINHCGIRAAVVAGEETVIGLARLFGFRPVQKPEFTAMPDTNLAAKVAATIDALQQHDFVVMHVKAPDVSAHDRKPREKMALLERFDSEIAPLLAENAVLAVSGDHCTDSNQGRHCGDPVPSLLYVPKGRADPCTAFGESHCWRSGMGRINATAFLSSMLDNMGALNTFQQSDAFLFFQK
jgi:2,3-bisphosphoglycerate-independent phosphoglycerate mutase|tara:strand:- start:2428 stop:3705 length:1278 start_codon:yes stop_codon:yes gene_type:complete